MPPKDLTLSMRTIVKCCCFVILATFALQGRALAATPMATEVEEKCFLNMLKLWHAASSFLIAGRGTGFGVGAMVSQRLRYGRGECGRASVLCQIQNQSKVTPGEVSPRATAGGRFSPQTNPVAPRNFSALHAKAGDNPPSEIALGQAFFLRRQHFGGTMNCYENRTDKSRFIPGCRSWRARLSRP